MNKKKQPTKNEIIIDHLEQKLFENAQDITKIEQERNTAIDRETKVRNQLLETVREKEKNRNDYDKLVNVLVGTIEHNQRIEQDKMDATTTLIDGITTLIEIAGKFLDLKQ